MDYTTIGTHDFYAFLLAFARVSGLFVAAPIFSSRTIPLTLKAGLALVISLAIHPLVAPLTGPIPLYLPVLAAVVMKNTVFGIAVGFIAKLFFAAVEFAGFFTDAQMGFSMMSILNPLADRPEAVMGVFQNQLAVTLFLLSNSHLALIGAVVDSFHSVSPDALVVSGKMALVVIPAVKAMFLLGFRLALPVAGVLLVTDLAFGLIARMAPQVNVFMVGMPAKVMIGLMTVVVLLPVFAVVIGELSMGIHGGVHALMTGAQ